MPRKRNIPVVDLFAGPGGLGEGFSSVLDGNERCFKIALSIENNDYAHQTLLLRSFFRQFPPGNAPSDYYDYLKGNIEDVNQLYEEHKDQYREASREAQKLTLGDSDRDEIRKAISDAIGKDKNWVLTGGPPCQAYSVIGRSRTGGIDPGDHRVTLYREYLRIIAEFQPAIFVMENVKGLLSAKIHGKSILGMMLKDLENPSSMFSEFECPDYRVYSFVIAPQNATLFEPPKFKNNKEFVIKSELFGIPQKRHRIILLGIRNDITRNPLILNRSDEKVRLEDVLSDLPPVRSGLSKTEDSDEEWRNAIREFGQNGFLEVLREHADPKIIRKVETYLRKVRIPMSGRGGRFVKTRKTIKNDLLREWYTDPMLDGVCNHETRGHMLKDLERYFFMSSYALALKESAKISDFPRAFLPNHKSIERNIFQDRFRVQLPDQPATTVTCHISKDGNYFIHYDPTQCRSLTVREAARIQTFPDNYLFCGSRTQQFHQVGNAVPVLLAKKIAEIVKDIFERAF